MRKYAAGGLGALHDACGFLTGLSNALVVDLPPGGVGTVVHAKRIRVASASAGACGVQAGMSVRAGDLPVPGADLLTVIRTVRPTFNSVIDAFDGACRCQPAPGWCRARPRALGGGENR